MEHTFEYYITITTRATGEGFNTPSFTTGVDGTEAAYDAWRKACDFAEAIGATWCDLWWGETGEVVASLREDEDEDDLGFDDDLFNDDAPIEWNDEELECGFNPYEGCYDWDC